MTPLGFRRLGVLRTGGLASRPVGLVTSPLGFRRLGVAHG